VEEFGWPPGATPAAAGYRLVWRLMPLRGAARFSLDLGAHAPPILPHLVPADGAGGFRLEGLAARILLGWAETARFGRSGAPRRLHRLLAEVLAALVPALGHPSLEALVLAATPPVRARHGARPAARMLTAGLNLVPESTALRVQLVLELGVPLGRAEAGERASVAGFFTRVHADLDPGALPPAALEHLDCPYLAALTVLGQPEARNRYFWRTAIRRVRDPVQRVRMIGLLREAPGERVGVSGTSRAAPAANPSSVRTRPVATGRGGRGGPVPSYPGRRAGGG
jgi:hypothetical protein